MVNLMITKAHDHFGKSDKLNQPFNGWFSQIRSHNYYYVAGYLSRTSKQWNWSCRNMKNSVISWSLCSAALNIALKNYLNFTIQGKWFLHLLKACNQVEKTTTCWHLASWAVDCPRARGDLGYCAWAYTAIIIMAGPLVCVAHVPVAVVLSMRALHPSC